MKAEAEIANEAFGRVCHAQGTPGEYLVTESREEEIFRNKKALNYVR